MPLTTPPLSGVRAAVAALESAGLEVALGGSGLLAAHGLVERVNDWDLTTDAPVDAVLEALFAAELPVFAARDGAPDEAPHASRALFSLRGSVDLIVGFALLDSDGTRIPLPTRVTGHWNTLPLGDLAVWRQAYTLLGHPTLTSTR
ncbi:hypothetical protein [Conexibacter woesei]|uniref:hypothetical protein n=1 Tax=Conexibacter woesei TaxID=191495 RepID=UPI0012DD2544|nr:hypothetical protein [Conexibacter woesei]